MFSLYDKLSEQNKSYAMLALGTVILLFTFGFLHKLLNYVLIGSGMYLVGMGLYRLDAHKKVMKFIKKQEQK